MSDFRQKFYPVLPLLAALTAPMLQAAATAPASASASAPASAPTLAVVAKVLSQQHRCSDTLLLRHAKLTTAQTSAICAELTAIEQRFHQLLNTGRTPVADDGNSALRANIYASRADFERFAGAHFNMPTDNGGMYLEGLPDKAGNQAEFVAYQRGSGEVWNLRHEYVHYLDGRFNLHGDFCANLHDSHAAPENCPQPAPLTPYLVWWTEGLAEYIAQGTDNPAAIALARDKAGKQQAYPLSELFNTGYISQGGTERVYRWGYLATRYLHEQHPDKVSQLLQFLRHGDYPRYQAVVKGWGTSLDADFQRWLAQL
ncbi:collagenase [Rheinheimera texasensis]|uniref:collagenase n=1 Tax=Rheinheimera texasensis TaxID=306205 RepID=UPI0032B1F3D6